MNFSRSILALVDLSLPLTFLLPLPSPAQSPSKLSPVLRNVSASPLGPSQRLSRERVDLSTITREDRDILQGSEQRMGESVTTLRRFRETSSPGIGTPIRPKEDLDREKVRRSVTVFDD